MRSRVHNSLWEAAVVLLPPEVPSLSLMRPGCCLSGGILQSCRSPDFQGAWPPEAASPDGGALFLSQLHCCEVLAAPPHARRASRRR